MTRYIIIYTDQYTLWYNWKWYQTVNIGWSFKAMSLYSENCKTLFKGQLGEIIQGNKSSYNTGHKIQMR